VLKTGTERKTADFDFSIETCQQPSNIIFENTHKSRLESCARLTLAILIMVAVMMLGFLLLYATQKTKDLLHRSYPEID
jgi:Tfp pilus assembly protein PilO